MPPQYPNPTLSGAIQQPQQQGQQAPQQQPPAGGGGNSLPAALGAAYGVGKAGKWALGKAGGVGGAMAGAKGLWGRVAPWGGALMANPVSVLSAGLNIGDSAINGDELDRKGVHQNSNWVSEKIHSTPFAGPALGTVWDATFGNAARGGETFGARVAYPMIQKARGKSTEIPALPGSEAARSPSAPAPSPHVSASPEAPQDSAITGTPHEQQMMSWLQSLPDRGMPGPRAMPPGAPGAPPPMAQQQHTAAMQAAAPHEGDATAVINPGMAQPTPNPGLQNHGAQAMRDPLENMLHQRLMSSMNPHNYLPGGGGMSFSMAGPVNPSGLPDQLSSMIGIAPTMMMPQQPVFPAGGPSVGDMANDQFNSSLSAMLGIRHARGQEMAAMGENQARMAQAQAAMMGAHADMDKAQAAANPLDAYLRHPAGAHVLEQQYPGISDALRHPGVAGLPGVAALSKNPDSTVEDWSALDEMMHRLQPGVDMHEFIRNKLLERHGTQGLESSRTPGWFGGGEAARRSAGFQRHLGLIQ